MSEPLLARQDMPEYSRLLNNLGQSLLVVGENGLDSDRLVDQLAEASPSDIISIMPAPDKKQISVMQIRQLATQLRTHPIRRRVITIKNAESMTEEAQNALLKVLEEPPLRTHFIINATHIGSLLPTIVSRCQVFQLHRTSTIQDNSLLKTSDVSAQTRQQILFLAAGRPTLIRDMIHKPSIFEQYRGLATDAKVIIAQSTYEALKVAQKYAADRSKAQQLTDVLVTMIGFQMKATGVNERTTELLERIEGVEIALAANGNVRLALLNVVI